MRKITFILCVLLLLMTSFGCAPEETIQTPVNFYYLRSGYVYGADTSMISAEIADAGSDAQNYQKLLQEYLTGPKDPSLRSPFPSETRLVSYAAENGVVTLTLSDAFAQLSASELTAACICLANTAMELTGCVEVVLCTENTPINGKDSITLRAEDYALSDEISTDVLTPTETEATP